MPLQTYLDEVLETQDGPWTCYDAVVTAGDIATLYKTGFLTIDYDPDKAQRGKDSVTNKPIVDELKIERWTDELVNGTAILGQLSWNFPVGESEILYDRDLRRLSIRGGRARIPDSGHRHQSVIRAVDSATRGSGFPLDRKFSVRIFNVPEEDEKRIFYAYNQEGKPADATRSKWLHPKAATQRLARELVQRSTHLTRTNVDTVRDRLSRRNPRLVAFGTLAKAFEDHWSDADLDGSKFEVTVDYLVRFWDRLVEVLPELGIHGLTERQGIRTESLVDSAVAIHGYVRLARILLETNRSLDVLDQLPEPIEIDGTTMAFFSRQNPMWVRRGVLVPVEKKDGTIAHSLRNARQSRVAMADALLEKVGIQPEDEPSAEAHLEFATA
jgi:hypothetical protein